MSIDRCIERQTLPLSDDTASFKHAGPRNKDGQVLLRKFSKTARHDYRFGHRAAPLPTQAEGGAHGQ
jgi:hypothetical protein